jgi:outer membrane protein TolC
MITTRSVLMIGLLTYQTIVCHAQTLQDTENASPPALSLSLRDAVKIALSAQGNYQLGIAAEAVNSAEAQAQQARGAFLPDIDTSLTGQNQILNLSAGGLQSLQIPISGFTVPTSSGQFSTIDARVHVRQDLMDFSASRRSSAAQASVATAKDETQEARDQVAARVARLYFGAQRAGSLVELQEQAVAADEASLQDATRRYAEGKALDIDVSHARTQEALAKQALLQAQLDRDRVRLELLSALNRSLDTPLKLAENQTLQEEQTQTPADVVGEALKARSDYLAQQERVKAAQFHDSSISSERLPTLVGFADAGSLGTTLANSIGTYEVGVSLKVPIFDRNTRAPQRAESQSLLRVEQLRLAQLGRLVELEVREALLKLEIARGQVKISLREVEVAKQELEHRQRLQQQGLAIDLQVSDAKLNLARANDDRSAAFSAWNEARVDLMLATGTIQSIAQ